MAPPLKHDFVQSDLRESPGQKILSIPSYGPKIDIGEVAAKEADFVIKRATEFFAEYAEPFHEIGERTTGAFDIAMQGAAASIRRGMSAVRDLSEEEPIRFIAMVASAAFVAGFALRLWRSSRA